MDVTCACGATFSARNSRAKYCSDRCRQRGHRGGGVVALPAPVTEAGAVEAATYRELEHAGQLDTSLGQTCLTLARRLDRPGLDTGSALASVAVKLDDLRSKALRGAGATSSPQTLRDELALRRSRHA